MVDNKGKINDWDRMVAGKLYNAGSKDIFKQHALGLMRCQRFNKIAVWRFKTKQRALERLIPSAKGKDFAVFAPLYCEYGVNVHVGKDCFVNYNCTFLDISPITFGDGVWIGANVTLATPLHPFLVEERLPADYPGVPARVIRQIDEDDRINVWDTYMKNETPLSARKRKATK